MLFNSMAGIDRQGIPAALQRALQLHQAGQLQQAAAIYNDILGADPENPHALHFLGLVAHRMGRAEIAVDLIGRATRIQPGYVEAHFNFGNVLYDHGRLQEAAAAYERAAELDPALAGAHHNLGNVLHDLGRLEDAVAAYRRALAREPDSVQALNGLGVACKDLGRLDEALDALSRAVARRPDYAPAQRNLGHALYAVGRLDEADAAYRRAIAAGGEDADVCAILGVIRQKQGRNAEALAMLRRAIELAPGSAAGYVNLGNALQEQGQVESAIEAYTRALEIDPQAAQVHHNLGTALATVKRLGEAADAYRRSIAIAPGRCEPLCHLTHLLRDECAWDELPALSARLIERMRASDDCLVRPFTITAASGDPGDQLRAASLYARQFAAPPAFDFSGRITPKPRLKLGYLSSDFRNHPVSTLTAELIELHDRRRFEVYGYSTGEDDGSPLRRRMERAFDHFVDLRPLAHMEAAQRIAADGIDILVDLNGYTQDSRPRILALKPAPVQVNYLGYPATMGADFMDYIIVDHFVAPEGAEAHFAEKPVYLPVCYQSNDRHRAVSPDTPSRADCGLPEEALVLCCFNNSYKITPAVFDAWMRVLAALPDAVLWLSPGSAPARGNLHREAQKRGIDPARVVFAERVAFDRYMAQYRVADLFLDTPVYNAGTTAADALWMGCPVVTCAGRSFASRMAGSLLNAVGVPDLVTGSLAGYEALVVELGRDRARLSALREDLARRVAASALFDTPRFTTDLERAFEAMWRIRLAGEAPRPIDVAALATATD